MQKRNQSRLIDLEKKISQHTLELAGLPIEEIRNMTDAALTKYCGSDLDSLTEEELNQLIHQQSAEVLASNLPSQAALNGSVWGKWGYTPESFRAYFQAELNKTQSFVVFSQHNEYKEELL